MDIKFSHTNGQYKHEKYSCDPEMVLLCKCCEYHLKKDSLDEIQSLVDSYQIDWPKLMKLARLHGLITSLYILSIHKVNDVPPSFMNRVRKTMVNLSQRNTALLKELQRIEQAFKKQGVKIVSYKGLPFAQQFYHNIHERYSVDVDYAISQENLLQCKSIMHDLEYVEAKGTVNSKDIKKSRAYYLDYPWIPKGSNPLKFSIDFHWSPSHDILKIPITFNQLIEESISLKINSITINSFNRVHQAFIVIIHHGNVDCWGKLRHLFDLALILKTLDSKEKEQLENLCTQYKIRKSLAIGYDLVDSLFGENNTHKEQKLTSKWLTHILTHKMVSSKWTESKVKIKYFLTSRDSWSDRFKAAYHIFKYQVFIKKRLD